MLHIPSQAPYLRGQTQASQLYKCYYKNTKLF